jgi:hypothetical protein
MGRLYPEVGGYQGKSDLEPYASTGKEVTCPCRGETYSRVMLIATEVRGARDYAVPPFVLRSPFH